MGDIEKMTTNFVDPQYPRGDAMRSPAVVDTSP
jgi:hypothetical protein